MGLVFSSLFPWYGFSIPMVSFNRFGMFLETHTAPTSLLATVGQYLNESFSSLNQRSLRSVSFSLFLFVSRVPHLMPLEHR